MDVKLDDPLLKFSSFRLSCGSRLSSRVLWQMKWGRLESKDPVTPSLASAQPRSTAVPNKVPRCARKLSPIQCYSRPRYLSSMPTNIQMSKIDIFEMK